MGERFTTQIRYVGWEPLFPSQIPVIELEYFPGVYLASTATIYEDVRMDNAEELRVLRCGLQGVTQSLIVIVTFVFFI